MRVIAGTAKGVTLRASSVSGLRPTSDLIRGAIFDMLGQFFEVETKVLDLYAGTGALGIEALSRGAGWADFVEQNVKACAVIRENLKAAGLEDHARVHCLPVQRASLTGPYDLIFMDPPYAFAPDVSMALLSLQGGGRLVLEHSRRSSPPKEGRIKQRRHGDTVISIYERQEALVG